MSRSLFDCAELLDLVGNAFAARSTTRGRIKLLLQLAMRGRLHDTKMMRVICTSASPESVPFSPLFMLDVLAHDSPEAAVVSNDRSINSARKPFAAEAHRRMQLSPDSPLEFFLSELLGEAFYNASPLKHEVLLPSGFEDVWSTIQPMPDSRALVLVAPQSVGKPRFDEAQLATLRALAKIIAQALLSVTDQNAIRVMRLRERHDLSHAQATVLLYVLEGRTESQIAERIDRSHHTVHGHLREIHRRLGVSSRAELLALHVIDPDGTTR